MTSKPSAASAAWTAAMASAVGTSGGRTPPMASTIAWIPNAAVKRLRREPVGRRDHAVRARS